MDNRSLINPGLGYLPPQAIDIEEAVLGACLLESEAVSKLLKVVTTKDVFYKMTNQNIFLAISSLSDSGNPVDMLTVSEELTKMGLLEQAGGNFNLVSITSKVNSAANIEYHIRILFEKFLKRRLIELSSIIQKEAYSDSSNVFELMDNLQLSLDSIRTSFVKSHIYTGAEVAKEMLDLMEEAMNRKGLPGITSGLESCDSVFSGWQAPDLIIAAGRPGMGKTGVTLGFARNAFLAGYAVGIFSLEMSRTQLMHRLVSAELYHTYGVLMSTKEVKDAKFSTDQFALVNKATAYLTKTGLYIDDTPALSIQQLRSEAITMVTKFGVKLLIVDYLQLMQGTGNNREQEIASIARGLKNIAKELSVPIIALSQINRAVESRGGEKKPTIADLRESGEIEQAADIIFFYYRPSYYGITEDENGQSTEDLCEILVRKHRNGPSPVDIPIFYKAMASIIKDSPLFVSEQVPVSTSKRIEPTKEQSSNSMPVGRNFYEKDVDKDAPFWL